MSIPDADQQEQQFAGSSGARKRRPLGKRAYEELKQLIMEGDIEPSGFLSERQLGGCEELAAMYERSAKATETKSKIEEIRALADKLPGASASEPATQSEGE